MDNWTCSANIELLNEEMAEEVNAMEMFDLMEINCAMVEKDMITITDLEIKRDQDECKKSGPEQNSIGAGPLHLCSWTTKGADRRCSVLSPFLAKPQICIFI